MRPLFSDALFSSARMDWRTPPHVIARVGAIAGFIGLDPCASPDPAHWFARENYTEGQDGLARPWGGRGLVYCNPPYGVEQAKWIRHAKNARRQEKAEVVLLIPARTDTLAWHSDIFGEADAICFWRGRLRFIAEGGEDAAPFPSAFVYYGENPASFAGAFGDAGVIWEQNP